MTVSSSPSPPITDTNIVLGLKTKLDASGHYDEFEVDRVNDLVSGHTTDVGQLSDVTTSRDKMLDSDASITQDTNNTKARSTTRPRFRPKL